MKKYVIGLIIISLAGFSFFMLHDKQVNATTSEAKDTRSKSYKNKTISAAIYEFKDKDIDYVTEYFSHKNKDTKVLAVKENKGYGFLAGEATIEDSSKNTTYHYNSDTDSNSATVENIIEAVAKDHKEN